MKRGYELTVENARKQSKEHKRCGTSFLLYVVIISIIFFVFIRVDNVILRMLVRIILVPVIAGVAYEFIRLAGRTNNIIVNILSKPGLWLQGLTTKEPDDDMLEVAIAAVEAVFDWRAYQGRASRFGHTIKSGIDEDFDDDINDIIIKPFSETFEEISLDSEEDDEFLQALDRYFMLERNKDEEN